MMIPPTAIFSELYNAPERKIRSAIRGFKREIGRLKRIIEDPDKEDLICPSHGVQLEMYREYLECAITALTGSGFEYTPSKREERSLAFNERLSDLRRLDFSFGGYFEGYSRYVINFGDGDGAEITHTRGLGDEETVGGAVISKQGCICALRDLYMGEWKTRYSTEALDGVEWGLKLEFFHSDGKRFYGSNAFPFSYEKLIALCRNLCSDEENRAGDL